LPQHVLGKNCEHMKIIINRDQYLELEKLHLGVFFPLSGFMTELEFESCVHHLKLPEGAIFPIPIVFDISKQLLGEAQKASTWDLYFEEKLVGKLFPTSFYTPQKELVAEKVFGTKDLSHPGVKHLFEMGDIFVGGQIELIKRPQFEFSQYELSPEETKAYFKKMGWKKVAGFQTRNAPHRAHEYLQRVALEVTDGLLIQPLVGKKKPGDFAPEAVLKGYEALIKNYYPEDRVKLSILSTVMRYAGPREALFHAIIRRNYGCTHFVVGRDHAGVGNFYDLYAAHKLVKKYEDQIGIEILALNGPYLCHKCDSIVTSKTCKHQITSPESTFEISGTYIRKQLQEVSDVDTKIIRPEVLEALKGMNPFI
jgi:sulfate adenylyltransferase